MKKVFLILVAFGLVMNVFAAVKDSDGNLIATWNPPQFGNPVAKYVLKYTINGVIDSITTEVLAPNTEDSSVVLTNPGDWAVYNIVAISIFDDTSVTVTSDTVYFDMGFIDPPTGVTWR